MCPRVGAHQQKRDYLEHQRRRDGYTASISPEDAERKLTSIAEVSLVVLAFRALF